MVSVGKFVVPALAVVAGSAVVFLLVRPPEAPTEAAPPPARPVNHVRVVVDSSASMAGYLSGKTEFRDTLARLIAGLPKLLATGNRVPQVRYAFAREIGSPFEPFTGTHQDLVSEFLNNKVMAGGSSMLQDVLGRVRQEIQQDQVDIVVTDGILSFSNEDIKKSPEINRDNVEGLAAQVQLAFQDAEWARKKITPGVAILQYSSRFNGTYYTYQNERLDCCAGVRPYYLWIVGDAPRVATVFAALRQAPGLAPQHAVVLGPVAQDARPRVLTYSGRAGTWTRSRTDILALENVGNVEQATQPQVTIALTLEALPDDVLTRDYVRRHLQIASTFAALAPAGLFTRAQMAGKLDPLDEADLARSTHFLTLSVADLKVDRAAVAVSLNHELPSWIRDTTTDDDRQTAVDHATSSKTFGLLPTIAGAARALGTGRPIFEFTLTLER